MINQDDIKERFASFDKQSVPFSEFHSVFIDMMSKFSNEDIQDLINS